MKLLSHAINLIFPAACNNCDSAVSADAATAYFCKECWQRMEWFDSPCCPQCGLPYPSEDNKPPSGQSTVGHLCGSCRKKPPCFDRVVSAGPYAGAISEAIKLFKYKKKVSLGKTLTEWALKSPFVENTLFNINAQEDFHTLWGCPVNRADKAISSKTLLVPVPLHIKRLREREFNQSAIIASVISRRSGIPLLANVLIRHRHTMPQVELGGMDRRENVAGAFSIEDSSLIEGKEIILVDDVYTSGSTVNECAKVMKKNGAEKVYVVTIARMVD